MKLSKQQKEILGWAYVISCKDTGAPFKNFDNKAIYLKPIRELIILDKWGHENPTRSESASISRSFTRLDNTGLIDRRYWHSFLLTSKGERLGRKYATPEIWERLSHLKNKVQVIDIKG